jgi:hypothetical protein
MAAYLAGSFLSAFPFVATFVESFVDFFDRGRSTAVFRIKDSIKDSTKEVTPELRILAAGSLRLSHFCLHFDSVVVIKCTSPV